MMLSSVGQTRSPLIVAFPRPRTTDSSFQIFSCPFSRRPQHHHHHHRQCRCRQITGELSLDRIKWKKLSLPADHPHPLPLSTLKKVILNDLPCVCVCVRFGAKFNFGLYRGPLPHQMKGGQSDPLKESAFCELSAQKWAFWEREKREKKKRWTLRVVILGSISRRWFRRHFPTLKTLLGNFKRKINGVICRIQLTLRKPAANWIRTKSFFTILPGGVCN